jgi:hypothetical protein
MADDLATESLVAGVVSLIKGRHWHKAHACTLEDACTSELESGITNRASRILVDGRPSGFGMSEADQFSQNSGGVSL